MDKNAIYPGTFDPLTNGHLDIIKRSLKIFDKITVLLALNTQKKTLFTLEERINQIKNVLISENIQDKVIVDCFDGLLVNYCRENDINIIIRGLRPLVDFEYEFEMAMANRELNHNIETIFILTDQNYFYLRSSLIKDVIKLGGDISNKIPPSIKDEVIKKIKTF
ncbi:MAG: pantetheine-phosphate adenylyltransferase [Spirochaetes bacterium GWC1_27_15]|nr:MAG: pantetheine-phosphate adenylyltransferase [Spirochaetes bacterium GWB1_27_13]OHD20249.1 MAG: pantetheine-phosphate adenylyltransferase [Spirochaetes bacterium GWC1_27_15]